MTPTVEKVARAICLSQYGNEAIHGVHRCCQVGGTAGCCAPDMAHEARAAIAAYLEGLVEEAAR